MSLIIATGSNIGDKRKNLNLAKVELSRIFKFIACSRIYSSAAIEYTEQDDFFNQVLEFQIPNISPTCTMDTILEIENKLGRKRVIAKGPRVIDIDIIFWGTQNITQKNLKIPHPSWHKRSFVVYPLQEIPFFQTLSKNFIIPKHFDNDARPIDDLYAV